jgi:hypothetical protein
VAWSTQHGGVTRRCWLSASGHGVKLTCSAASLAMLRWPCFPNLRRAYFAVTLSAYTSSAQTARTSLGWGVPSLLTNLFFACPAGTGGISNSMLQVWRGRMGGERVARTGERGKGVGGARHRRGHRSAHRCSRAHVAGCESTSQNRRRSSVNFNGRMHDEWGISRDVGQLPRFD